MIAAKAVNAAKAVRGSFATVSGWVGKGSESGEGFGSAGSSVPGAVHLDHARKVEKEAGLAGRRVGALDGD